MAGKKRKKTRNSIDIHDQIQPGKTANNKAEGSWDRNDTAGETCPVPSAALPGAFTARIKEQLGDAYPAFLDSYQRPSAGTLRLNTLRMDKDTGITLCRLAGLFSSGNDAASGSFTPVSGSSDPGCPNPSGSCLTSVPWDPDGLYYDPESRPGKNILHEAGLYYMQEASAMLPGRLLMPQPGEKILDLCAAPGGKSVQIGMAMKGKGLLVSNEIHPARAAVLSENIERMGITNALVTNEDPARLSASFPFFFDRILVDAPCSGEGMFRKHPEAALEWSPENVTMCSERQLIILESAHIMLRPGGRLVYSTCTFSKEENENVIREFLRRHPEYHPLTDIEAAETPADPAAPVPVIPASCGVIQTDPGCYRIYPHLAPGEGHFAAVLVKDGFAATGSDISAEPLDTGVFPAMTTAGLPIPSDIREKKEQRSNGHKKNKRSDKKQTTDAALYKPLYAFFEDTLTDSCSADFISLIRSGDTTRLYTLGQQIYLLPEGSPPPDGIRLQRPGLHLGTLKNDRFEPSLALARTLSTADAKNYVNLCILPATADPDSDPIRPGTVTDRHYADDSDYSAKARYLQDYFAGNTLPAADQKDWTLVCIAGIGIGWGKSSNGIIKNHYPKGLRKQLET